MSSAVVIVGLFCLFCCSESGIMEVLSDNLKIIMYYGYFDPISLVFHILGWILIIWLVVWLVRGARHNNHNRHMRMRDMWNGHNKALDLLKERYAKGEINKEEYEEKKKVLSE